MKFYLLSNDLGNTSKINELFMINVENEYIMISENAKIINIFSEEKMNKMKYINKYFKYEKDLYEVYFSLDIETIKKNIKNALIIKDNEKMVDGCDELKEKIINILGAVI